MRINLCFHGIGDTPLEREPGEPRYWITPGLFQRIMDEVPRFADVALSFDDGNRSDVDLGLPALLDRGLGATFFALAGRLDDGASLAPGDLRHLRASGMRIGSHGWAHVPWRDLSDSDARRELTDARIALEEASGGAIPDAALPLGRYDRRLLVSLKRLGYETVYTSDRFPARRGSWLQARYSVMADDTVDSVRAVLRHRVRPGDAVKLAKSVAKRLR
jgi:peptidoglycan/xylan/chitin deacetylase (PgdA/CDA1 family)